MLREKWQEKVLGDLITLEYGSGLPESSRSGSGFPVYGSSGIVGQHTHYLVNGPGIVIGRKGTVGAVAWSKGPFWPIDTAYYVNTKCEVEIRWCYWLLQSIGLDRLDSSTGVPGLNRNDAYIIKVKIPPIPEQRCIAEILDTIDEAIQKTEALISKLKTMKQGLLHDLLTRGLDKNGKLRDPKTHPEQFKDSPLGRMPIEWQVGSINNLAINCDGRRIPLKQADRDKRHGIYPYYGASGIIDWIDDYLFDGDYVLLGEDGENVVSRELPLAFRASGKFWVNNHAHVFEPRPSVDIRYLTELLEYTNYNKIFLGSAQPKLTQEGLKRLLFQIPMPSEQAMIGDRLETYDARIRTEEQYRDKLKLQKKGLMHDFLTGKVRVQI